MTSTLHPDRQLVILQLLLKVLNNCTTNDNKPGFVNTDVLGFTASCCKVVNSAVEIHQLLVLFSWFCLFVLFCFSL